MRRLWLVTSSGAGVLALGLGSLGAAAAGAAPSPKAHSDQVITVMKTDPGGVGLQGAVFTLYPWHGSTDLSSPLMTATSDSSGRAVFDLEGHHNYAVVETKAPANYNLSSSAPVVVKTAHQTNTKRSDDRANVKESAKVTFVDTPIVTPPPPPENQSSGGGTSGSNQAAVPGATTVHTGGLWAGSGPYAVGAMLLGSSILGTGLLLRRRRLVS
jgi:hypothetical protein